MGLFTTTPRKSVTYKDTTPKDGTSRPRLSFGSILSRRNSSISSARRSSTPVNAPIKKTKSLTVLVDPAQPAIADGPCRFVVSSTKLGSGAYGAVLLGHDLCTQAPVAIKFIPDGRMRESSLAREVSLLQRLSDANHPALVKFHGHVRPADVKAGEIRAEGPLPLPKPHTTCHALVMEPVRGGELFDYVVKCEGLKESEAGPLFGELCDAVQTAHGLGVTHRDLKLENVLLVRKKNAPISPRMTRGGVSTSAAPQSRIKLIDWGLAHQHSFHPDGSVMAEMLHSRCGSRSYMAPEVTNRDISSTIGYDGFAADVWSLGVCLFAIHLAFFPFEQAHPDHDWRARRVIEAQKAGRSTMATILAFYPQKASNGGLSPSLLALLDRMLVFDPRKRATLAKVLCSEWLAPHVPVYTVPRALSIAHLATRSSRSISSSSCSCSFSDGMLTPRSGAEGDGPPPFVPMSARPPVVDRIDSSGTVHTTSSIASIASSLAETSGLPRERAVGAIAAAVRRHLPPPPPSPTMSVVVAGGSQIVASATTKHGQEIKEPLEIASMLTKACKLSNIGSPRKPDRAHEHAFGEQSLIL